MTAATEGAAAPVYPRTGISNAGAAWLGLREALFGGPVLVLAASFLGFGALIRANDFGLLPGLGSTVLVFALPAQVALVELYAVGASLLTVTLAVALTNMRLLPMLASLYPQIPRPRASWPLYVVAHIVAITSWVIGMRRFPEFPPDRRLAFLAGLGIAIWPAMIAATGIGFFLAGSVPTPISLGLVFLNPLYFLLMIQPHPRQRAHLFAIMGGAVLGPVFHLLDPDLGLLATGLVAGTGGFAADRLARRRGRRPGERA